VLHCLPGRDHRWSSPDIQHAIKGLAMTNVRAVDFPPLEFVISLGPDRSFVVREMRGRSSGAFDELSDAVLFVRGECQACGCAVGMKFDQNLACIRAAG
jgi:hypothetical protein